jgi:hypothetical protein
VKYILYIFLLLFFSCGDKTQEKTEVIKKKPLLSIVNEHSKIGDVLISYKKDIENWEEFNLLNSFISKFKKTSPNEALSNAIELKELVKNLKDSIIPEKFNIPPFNARVNILYNESLRLTDLTYIPSIKAEEVNAQIDKVLNSFSSLKGKINTIITQKKFEEAIDIDMNFIGIDSTKIDSISKNSIKIIKKKNDSKRLEKGIVLYPNFIEIDSTKLNGISKKSSKILRNQRIQKSKAQIKKQ